jgi:parvulin-like peptidyl-prolyl isomerase
MKKILFYLAISFNVIYADLVNAVAVYVEDEAITLYDIVKIKDKFGLSENKAVDYLIDRILREQEIKNLNIEVSDFEVEQEIDKIAQMNGMSVDNFKSFLESKHISWDNHFKDVKEKLLIQKLFKKISYPRIKLPTDKDLLVYYTANSDKFTSYNKFDLIEYSSSDVNILNNSKQNPMYLARNLKKQKFIVESKSISPKLLTELIKTESGTFTKNMKIADNKYVSFYVKNKLEKSVMEFGMVKNQILEILIKEQESKIVKSYFDNLRINSDINVVR